MRNITIKRVAIDALFLCVLIISSLISFPLGSIPVTLQVFGVFLIILILRFDSIIVFLVYMLMGSLGLPVFAGGTSGIMLPTYGFLIGFLISTIVLNIFNKYSKIKKEYLKFIIEAVMFMLITYIFGLPYCMVALKMSFSSAILYFLPFIGIDIVKIIIVFLIYKRIKNVIYFE